MTGTVTFPLQTEKLLLLSQKSLPMQCLPSNTRPSWHETWMNQAKEMSRRATCPRLSVGAILVRDNGIVVSGYNGSPAGLPHCKDVGCRMVDGHCKRALHAEDNIILWAAREGKSTKSGVLYLTHQPCSKCINQLIQAQIKAIVFEGNYYDPATYRLAHLAKLPLFRYTDGLLAPVGVLNVRQKPLDRDSRCAW